ncbi:MAG: PDZ domain-containing protein, partial [Verrucomicrobiales bacterium]|nr:PDZ domain-containing protein [Verrucomicrobiales bacterium]
LQARANSFTLPVMKDGKLVGTLLSYNSKEQTSAILPAPIIQAFLADLDDGNYDGFPDIGLSYSQMLDEQLRKFTGVEGEGGIYIRSVSKDGSAGKAGIEKGDVVMAINGNAIDSRGNYEHPEFGRINFSHIVRGSAKVGDTAKFDIVRDGKEQTIDVKLERKLPQDYLVDPYMFDRGPKYIIFGGLIFQELTLPYLKSWGQKWSTQAPFKLVHANANPEKYEKEGREKLVFLSNVLKTPSTLGYENLGGMIVTKVNGTEIKDIQDLHDAFAKPPENGIHRIEFPDYPKVIFVHDDISRQINQQLIQYGIAELERLK